MRISVIFLIVTMMMMMMEVVMMIVMVMTMVENMVILMLRLQLLMMMVRNATTDGSFVALQLPPPGLGLARLRIPITGRVKPRCFCHEPGEELQWLSYQDGKPEAT